MTRTATFNPTELTSVSDDELFARIAPTPSTPNHDEEISRQLRQHRLTQTRSR